jgi:hypothetical protein
MAAKGPPANNAQLIVALYSAPLRTVSHLLSGRKVQAIRATRHDTQQKRDHAFRDAENQKRQCCKRGRHHNDRNRPDDPCTCALAIRGRLGSATALAADAEIVDAEVLCRASLASTKLSRLPCL